MRNYERKHKWTRWMDGMDTWTKNKEEIPDRCPFIITELVQCFVMLSYTIFRIRALTCFASAAVVFVYELWRLVRVCVCLRVLRQCVRPSGPSSRTTLRRQVNLTSLNQLNCSRVLGCFVALCWLVGCTCFFVLLLMVLGMPHARHTQPQPHCKRTQSKQSSQPSLSLRNHPH